MVSPSSPPALFLSPTGVRRYIGNKLSLTSSSLSSPRKGSFHPPRDGLNRRGISKIVSTCIRKSFSRTQPSMQRLIHPLLLNRQSVSLAPSSHASSFLPLLRRLSFLTLLSPSLTNLLCLLLYLYPFLSLASSNPYTLFLPLLNLYIYIYSHPSFASLEARTSFRIIFILSSAILVNAIPSLLFPSFPFFLPSPFILAEYSSRGK